MEHDTTGHRRYGPEARFRRGPSPNCLEVLVVRLRFSVAELVGFLKQGLGISGFIGFQSVPGFKVSAGPGWQCAMCWHARIDRCGLGHGGLEFGRL